MMKKIILITNLFLFGIMVSNAQQSQNQFPTNKGKWLIESNTGFGNIHAANTGLHLKITNGTALWNIGGEAGYFVADRLALKLGLGFGNFATGLSSVGGEGGEGGGETGGETGGGEAGEGSSSGSVGTGGAAIAGIGPILSYKLGAKYYLMDKIPIQVDFSGTNVTGYNMELGFQVGYAFFLGERNNISLEPGIRYSLPLQTKANTIDNTLQLNAGFTFYF